MEVSGQLQALAALPREGTTEKDDDGVSEPVWIFEKNLTFGSGFEIRIVQPLAYSLVTALFCSPFSKSLHFVNSNNIATVRI